MCGSYLFEIILRVAVRRTPLNGLAPLPKMLRRVAVLDGPPLMLKFSLRWV